MEMPPEARACASFYVTHLVSFSESSFSESRTAAAQQSSLWDRPFTPDTNVQREAPEHRTGSGRARQTVKAGLPPRSSGRAFEDWLGEGLPLLTEHSTLPTGRRGETEVFLMVLM